MGDTNEALAKGTLNKVEEKAFRKYVKSFIEDANKIENPITRLNECVDILSCFEEGNCPDLREALEKRLLEEKKSLEYMVEKVISTERDYDMNIDQFRASAERNTAQGVLLNEQVTDYEILINGLTQRNRFLKEENEKLRKANEAKDQLSEKKILDLNKQTVEKSKSLSSLEEKVGKLEGKNRILGEKVTELSRTNKRFEKENDILAARMKEATEIIKVVKEEKMLGEGERKQVLKGVIELKERVADLEKTNKTITEEYDTQCRRFDALHEKFKTYKKDVNDTYNPMAHVKPMFEERVGKYLDLRENKGIEIDAYWNDLVNKYGDAVIPFENKIRGAKTLREATSCFLKNRMQIDPNFSVAAPVEQIAFRNQAERAKLYEAQGIINPIDSYRESSLEDKNEAFLAPLLAAGLV